MTRRDARRHAFILVYQIPFHPEEEYQEILELYLSELETESIVEAENEKENEDKKEATIENESTIKNEKRFITSEFSGTIANIEKINELISKHSMGWTIDRINKIDLAILRLAVYEIIFEKDIPSKVSINEAVELAKSYGIDESSSFINGILGTIIKNLE